MSASSGTRLVATTVLSSVPSRSSYDFTTAAVRGSSASALVIGTSSKNRSTRPDACRFTSMRATNFASEPALLISVRFSVAVMG